MWTLLLVILVNGGTAPSKFAEQKFTSEQSCLAAQHRAESATVYGYCTFKRQPA